MLGQPGYEVRPEHQDHANTARPAVDLGQRVQERLLLGRVGTGRPDLLELVDHEHRTGAGDVTTDKALQQVADLTTITSTGQRGHGQRAHRVRTWAYDHVGPGLATRQ